MSTPPVLHPLGVGELLDAAIYIYRKNFVTLVGICAVISVPFLLFARAGALLDVPGNPFSRGEVSLLEPPAAIIESPLNYLVITVAVALLGAVIGVLQIAALVFAVSEGRMGRGVTIAGAYRQALRCWSALLGSTVLLLLFDAVCFGPFLLALIAPMLASGNLRADPITPPCLSLLLFLVVLSIFVYVIVHWSVIAPAIMVENLGALKGMGRSWRLVKGSFRRTIVVLLIAGVPVYLLTDIVTWGVGFGASAFLGNSPALATLVTSAASLAVTSVLYPLLYTVTTLLYYDLRVRHEGYDLQLALDQLKQPATAVATEAPA